MYLAVTTDKYELPIAVADTAVELAKMLKIPVGLIYSEISKDRSGKRKTPGKIRGFKFISIEDGD